MSTFDPFAVLGMSRRYDVDAAEVERMYLERSAALHPDVAAEHAMAGMGDEGGDDTFAELSRARQVLSDPEQRAVTLWKLWGGVEDKTLPPGLLMEMMEVREEIEQAAGDPAAVAKWEAWAGDRRSEYQRKVGGLFAKLSPGGAGNASVLREIKLELNGWRYVERLIEQL
jgi:molecular chaperone HscB